MERYFILDKFNTFYDWDLILTAKSITPPDPNAHYVNIDGMSGSLDLSESLTGEITYKDRTITASFWTDQGNFKSREKLLRDIISTLHGKKVKIIEPDDPDHYFVGRIKVKTYSNTLPFITFTIEATCEPYRYALTETVRTVDITDETDVVIRNTGVKTLSPMIHVTSAVNIVYEDVSVQLSAGTYKISDIKLKQGFNVIKITGSGSVTFTYREADL